MNKKEFLANLKFKIRKLPKSDIEESLDYYSEIIDDSMEDGLSEQEAIEKLGDIDKIASQILMDKNLSTTSTSSSSTSSRLSRPLRAWEIVLLVIGSPLWLPLLLAILSLIFVIYLLIWVIEIMIYAVFISFVFSFFTSIVQSIILLFSGNFIQSLLSFSTGLILLGLSILMFFASYKTTLFIIESHKKLFYKIKMKATQKEENVK